jgi:mersacidin/lichenicidin family type 2 lantibiotic
MTSRRCNREGEMMKKIDLGRAFRDEDYYLSLSEAERASLPTHPAALIEVREDELKAVAGATTEACTVSGFCSPCPRHVCV